MSEPNKFIQSSDFPTLKNDSTLSAQGTISGSINISSFGNTGGYVDGTIGQLGAVARGRIASSKNSNIYYVGQSIAFQRTGTVGGSPAPYTLFAFMYRVSADTLRFQVHIPNPYGATLTTQSGDDTIYFYVNTFLPPYT